MQALLCGKQPSCNVCNIFIFYAVSCFHSTTYFRHASVNLWILVTIVGTVASEYCPIWGPWHTSYCLILLYHRIDVLKFVHATPCTLTTKQELNMRIAADWYPYILCISKTTMNLKDEWLLLEIFALERGDAMTLPHSVSYWTLGKIQD
jgi:hypothetical protein